MATDIKPMVHNPFRSQTVTPNPTGAGPSTSAVVSASSPQPQLDSRQTTTASANIAREQSPPRRDRRSADDLAADLQETTLEDNTPLEPPPAYTPAANPYEGEATVEYGPQRPFQPAPPPPPLPQQFSGMQQQFTGMSQGGPFISPHATGMPMMPNRTGGWNPHRQGPPSNGPSGYCGPPPQHPALTGSRSGSSSRLNATPAPTSNGMSPFARDFYAAPPRIPSPVPSNVSSDGVPEPEHFERVVPPSSPGGAPGGSSASYAPPNGPPPSVSPSSPYPPPNVPPPLHTRSSNNTDDWKPTTTPTPGRPLLNKGRVLVYPSGYECKKCLNTGYKSFDPSHPCRKCWDKHSKPYAGALMYAPRSQQSQRPLPNLRPPHLRHQQTQSQSQPSLLAPPSPSPSNLIRSQSAYRPSAGAWQGYPGRAVSSSCVGPGASPGGFLSPSQPMPMPMPQLNVTRGLPPPGSVVVHPGDSRIGGRLCWRCDGTGTVSFLIFDIEQCPVCRGIGRTFQ